MRLIVRHMPASTSFLLTSSFSIRWKQYPYGAHIFSSPTTLFLLSLTHNPGRSAERPALIEALRSGVNKTVIIPNVELNKKIALSDCWWWCRQRLCSGLHLKMLMQLGYKPTNHPSSDKALNWMGIWTVFSLCSQFNVRCLWTLHSAHLLIFYTFFIFLQPLFRSLLFQPPWSSLAASIDRDRRKGGERTNDDDDQKD